MGDAGPLSGAMKAPASPSLDRRAQALSANIDECQQQGNIGKHIAFRGQQSFSRDGHTGQVRGGGRLSHGERQGRGQGKSRPAASPANPSLDGRFCPHSVPLSCQGRSPRGVLEGPVFAFQPHTQSGSFTGDLKDVLHFRRCQGGLEQTDGSPGETPAQRGR